MQEDIKRTGDKYGFVQEIKGYISDLCDCLADKAALVEELEDQLQEFREERAEGDKARLQVRGVLYLHSMAFNLRKHSFCASYKLQIVLNKRFRKGKFRFKYLEATGKVPLPGFAARIASWGTTTGCLRYATRNSSGRSGQPGARCSCR